MSVITRATVGVGFKVEKSDLIDFFGKEKYDEWGGYDLLDDYLSTFRHVHLVTGGSPMNGDVEYVISVRRLEETLDAYEDAGVWGLDRPVLELDERIALFDAAADLLGREPRIGQFVAIYVG